MKMVDIQQINRELVCDPAGFARQANAAYDAQIEAVARDLRAHRDEHPILLLSGPSGSGKTTTALKIEKLLESWGCVAHTLSLDNYFLPFSEEGMEQVRRGLIDLESPARVDAELLGAQLSDMVAGKSVPLPRYDFQTAQRVYTGETMTRLPGEIVILEGIHALNHDVIRIPDEYAARAYISACMARRARCSTPRASACCAAWCVIGSTAGAASTRRCTFTPASSAGRLFTSCPTSTARPTRSIPFSPMS